MNQMQLLTNILEWSNYVFEDSFRRRLEGLGESIGRY